MKPIFLSKNRNAGRYNYVDLTAVEERLNEEGYDVDFMTEYWGNDLWTVKSRVKVKGKSEWEPWNGLMPIRIGTTPQRGLTDAQQFGSALTYARRYSLFITCNIVPDDDDDGASAGSSYSMQQHPLQQQRQQSQAQQYQPQHQLSAPLQRSIQSPQVQKQSKLNLQSRQTTQPQQLSTIPQNVTNPNTKEGQIKYMLTKHIKDAGLNPNDVVSTALGHVAPIGTLTAREVAAVQKTFDDAQHFNTPENL